VHITRLIDDLLDVSRISSGKFELRTQRVRFAEIIDEAVTICRPLVDARRHRLSIVGDDGDLLVDGDHTRLVQVLANLLSNAARYTPEGGAIEVSWGSDGGQVFARVTDNGIGIAPEVIDRVFDMFVQEHAGVEGNAGLGLGLTLAYQLTRLH